MSLRRIRPAPAPPESGPEITLTSNRAPAVPRRDFLARTAAAFGAGLLAFAGRPALPGGGQARAATTGIDPFIGEIMLFAGNFAPYGYAFCEGQLMPIAQNTALFSILGTIYGGDGQTTFALPDLRGRAPIHTGQGAGLPLYALGEKGGSPSHTLTVNELPQHTHTAFADSGVGTSSSPAAALPARDPSGTPTYGTNAVATLASSAISAVGGSQPHSVQSPYLAMHYCIALQGIFPTRS